jgi:hypothetical protein
VVAAFHVRHESGVPLGLAATLPCDAVIAGSVQPMTHATTAIQKETPTAVPALTMCDVERIPIATIRLLEQNTPFRAPC